MTIKTDEYEREILDQEQAIEFLLKFPDADLSNLTVQDAEQFNQAAETLYMNCRVQSAEQLDMSPAEFHHKNQHQWNMPREFAEFDIAEWLLNQCENEEQTQRVGHELLLYAERDMLDLLCFMRYVVHVMRENNVVWGIGRGSSVSSYVLYLIGVHRVDSLYYDLEVEEFLR